MAFFDGKVDVYEHVEEKMMLKFETLTYSNGFVHFYLLKIENNLEQNLQALQIELSKLRRTWMSFLALIYAYTKTMTSSENEGQKKTLSNEYIYWIMNNDVQSLLSMSPQYFSLLFNRIFPFNAVKPHIDKVLIPFIPIHVIIVLFPPFPYIDAT